MSDTFNERNKVELLAEEFLARKRNGEHPSMTEYVEAHPELADEIREVFPAVIVMEKFRPNSDDLTAGFDGSPQETTLRERIGDYRIVREIGRGGMGVVYEAEQQSLGRRVALKVLPMHASDSRASIARFRREARAAARLHHTNIVPVFEVGQDGDTCYYAMQFIQGQGLDQVQQELARLRDESRDGQAHSAANVDDSNNNTARMSRDETGGQTDLSRFPGRLDLSSVQSDRRHYYRSVARIGRQAAEALDYAHNRGIIHRDIKPSNLLLDGAGVVWIADFGLAKTPDEALTETGDMLGTLRYMSPERLSGQCDARADIYGLGLTLYELLTFKPAYESANHLQLVEEVTHREPARPRTIDPDIPRDLETVILKAIDKSPRLRYQSAADLAEDLRRFIDDEPVHARRVWAIERLARWSRRNKSIAVSLSAVAGLLVLWVVGATAAAAHFKSQEEEQRQLKEKEAAAKTEAQNLAEERRARLVRFNVARGVQYMEQNDLLASLPWFVQALQLDSGDKERDEAHRVRLATVLARCPKLVHLWQYRLPAEHVQLSGDGRFLLVVYYDHVAVHDTISGETVFQFHHSWSRAIGAISPDGRALLVADKVKGISTWDIPSGKKLGAVEFGANVTVAAYDNGGGRFAVGDAAGKAQVFNASTLEPVGQPIWHKSRIEHLAFSADNRYLATASRDKTARISYAATGRRHGPLLQHGEAVLHVAFGPNSRRLLTSSWDKTARLWEIKSSKELARLEHRSVVVYASFSPKGDLLATASMDQTAQVWDAKTGSRVGSPLKHNHFLRTAQFSPDGKLIVTASEDRTARIWNALTGEEVASPLHQGGLLTSALFHPDGRHVITASQNGVVRQWLWQGDEDVGPLMRHTSPVYDVAITDDRRKMATASADKTARLWDVATGRPLCPPLQHDAVVKRVVFSPDGGRLATAALDFSIRVWDVQTAKPITPPLKPQGWENVPRQVYRDRVHVAFSPDGKKVAGGFACYAKKTGVIQLWDAQTGKQAGPPMVHPDLVLDINFGPAGERLVSGCWDGKARIWRVSDSKELVSIDHVRPVRSASLSPAGDRLVTTTGFRTTAEVRVWDALTGKPVTPPMHHQGVVNMARFSPHGNRIVTGSHDHTARIWDAGTGKPLTAPIVHGEGVQTVAFSPNGKFILTACSGMHSDPGIQRGVRVWDATNGQPVTPLPLLHRNTSAARFTQDGRAIAIAATQERGGKLWRLEPDTRPLEDWIALAKLLSAQSIDSTDAMTPAEAAELVAANNSLQAKYPRQFFRQPEQRLAKIREAAKRCMLKRQWASAKSYVEALRAAGQDDEELRRIANETAWGLLSGADAEQLDHREMLVLARFAIPKARRAAADTINWSVLKPIAMHSTDGAVLSLQDDSSILASGENPRADSYIVVCDTDLEGITGLKLETLTHPSLPNKGPGRHSSGRFLLSEITLKAAARLSGDKPKRIELENATADFNQFDWHITEAVDGNDLTGWGINPQRGRPHHAVFETQQNISHPGGSRLTIQLDFHDPTWFMHNMGRFRLLATTDPRPLGVEQHIVKHSTHPLGCWTVLAMAQLRAGQAEEALGSLRMAAKVNDGGVAHDWFLMSLAHGHLGEKEKSREYFDQAFAWIKKNKRGHPLRRLAVAALAQRVEEEPNNSAWRQHRSQLLLQLGREDEAVAELTGAIEVDEKNIQLYTTRGNYFGRRARWREAAADFCKIIEIDPGNHFNWFLALPLLWHSGELDEYRIMRRRLLERFGDTRDVRIADRAAKASLLDPMISGAESDTIHKLAELAVTRGARRSSAKWYHAAAAMADFRNGQYEAAAGHTTNSRRLSKCTAPSLDALTYLIEAMCQQNLEKPDSARRSLESANRLIERVAALPPGDRLPGDWYNWLICLIVQHEAQRVVGAAQ